MFELYHTGSGLSNLDSLGCICCLPKSWANTCSEMQMSILSRAPAGLLKTLTEKMPYFGKALPPLALFDTK